MKEKLLTYKGYINNLFCFLDATGKYVKFKKSRKELIENFQLLDRSNIGRTFLVKYFMVAEGDFDTYILSDLEYPKISEESDQ